MDKKHGLWTTWRETATGVQDVQHEKNELTWREQANPIMVETNIGTKKIA